MNPIETGIKRKLGWRNLWIKKIDYIHSYFGDSYQNNVVDESINYYVSMLEAGIYMLKRYKEYYDYNYFQHRIIFSDNLYDIKEDIKERDVSEYLKYIFFINNYNFKDISEFIGKGISRFNYELVVARLLYYTYYFYYLDEYMLKKEGEDILVNIINRSSEYEVYVKYIVREVNKYMTKKIVLPF